MENAEINGAPRPLSSWSGKPPSIPPGRARPRWSLAGHRQRWRLGGAFYMAEEVAAQLPAGTQLLDVGCGDGFIAHHLSGLLGRPAHGVDVRESTEAPITYRCFDGVHLPYADRSFEALLCAYVLHHTSDCRALLADMARVLAPGGTLVVYEDLPRTLCDRVLCWRHDRSWRARTGPSSFFSLEQWTNIFSAAGFMLRLSTPLSRMRDWTHPVARQFFVLTKS